MVLAEFCDVSFLLWLELDEYVDRDDESGSY